MTQNNYNIENYKYTFNNFKETQSNYKKIWKDFKETYNNHKGTQSIHRESQNYYKDTEQDQTDYQRQIWNKERSYLSIFSYTYFLSECWWTGFLWPLTTFLKHLVNYQQHGFIWGEN